MFQGYDVFLTSIEVIIRFWDEICIRSIQYYGIITMRRRFKGVMGGKWHIILLVDMATLEVEVR